MSKPVIVGLTGQSGAGKTTVSDVFKREGFAVIDCDKIARKAVEPGTDCSMELSSLFPEIFDGERLDRKKAAETLFADRHLLGRYNSAIFPHIIKLIRNEIDRFANEGYEYVLLDAPTLFEAGADKLCSRVVSCVACYEVRIARIIARDGISRELAEKRFSSQKSEEFFRNHSDYIIENNCDRETAEKAAEEIIKKIKGS